MSESPATRHESARFNAAMLVGDVSCYMIGMAFLDTSTVLPRLVHSLGGDAAFLGLLLSLRQAAGLVGPILIAHPLQGKAKFKPTLMVVCFSGRVLLLPAALMVYFFGDRYPFLVLCLFAAAMLAAWLGDGMGMVPWTALVGKMIPARQRGKLFAGTQLLAGISRLFISGAVAVLLSGHLVGFPRNMGTLVGYCALALGASSVFILCFREPNTPAPATAAASAAGAGFAGYLRSLPEQMRQYPAFSRLAVVQIFLTATGAAMPFVIGYAESLGTHLPDPLPLGLNGLLGVFQGGLAGLFLAVQTAGMLLFAPAWGLINDRLGPRTAILGLFGMATLCPLLSLFAGLTGGNLALFLLAYFFLGASMDWWIPVTNYLIESIPTEKQATFFGLISIVSAPALALPLMAGFLMRQWGAPPLLFETLSLLLVGLMLALRLPSTRHKHGPPPVLVPRTPSPH